MDLLIGIFNGITSSFIPFVLLLGVLVFIHEFGHFIVAKMAGVRVEVFSIGFGKKLFQYKHGDTNYCVSLIPLGGYVKMFGDDPSKEISEEEKRYSFLHQPLFQRYAIVAAGPLINFLFAIFLFSFLGLYGENYPGSQLGDLKAGTVAHTAGFRSGDQILKVGNVDVKRWRDVQKNIELNPDKDLSFLVKRSGKEEVVAAKTKLIANRNIFSLEPTVGSIEGLSTTSLSTLIGVSNKESFLSKLGVKSLSFLDEVNGNKIKFWREIAPALLKSKAPYNLTLTPFDGKKKGKAYTVVAETLPTMNITSSDFDEIAKIKNNYLKSLGFEKPETFLLNVKKGSPADLAGLKVGDKLVNINGSDINKWEDVLASVKSYDETNKDGLDFVIARTGEKQNLKIIPEMTEILNPIGNPEKRFTVGIIPAYYMLGNDPVFIRTSNIIEAAKIGIEKSVHWTKVTMISFLRLFQGQVSVKNLGGVVTIGRVASQSYDMGLSAFLRVMAIISINLFILNLLPIPVLDGGHLVFFTLEALNGRPLSLRKMEIAQTAGFVFLSFFMVFAFYNDIANWYKSFGW